MLHFQLSYYKITKVAIYLVRNVKETGQACF